MDLNAPADARRNGRWPWTLLALALLALAASPVHGAPIRDPGVRAGDCAGCHTGRRALPDRHVLTQSMDYAHCRSCHTEGTTRSLQGVLPLSHLHRLAGIACSACHLPGESGADAAQDRCSTCHDTGKLAAATKDVKPANPHESPHYGREMDCNLCHHQHAKSEDYCLACHDFGYRVP